MKRKLYLLAAIMIIPLLFLSCDDTPKDTTKDTSDDSDLYEYKDIYEPEFFYSIEEAAETIGAPTTIKDPVIPEARYFNAQTGINLCGFSNLTFNAKLAVYETLNDDIDAKLVKYLDQMDYSGYSMHQQYDVDIFDTTKYYVEFCTYSQGDTVQLFELRVTYPRKDEQSERETRAVFLSPDLKVDVTTCYNIYTNKYCFYFGKDWRTKNIDTYPAFLDKLGEVKKVYKNYGKVGNKEEEILFDYDSEVFYIEYTSLKNEVINYYESINTTINFPFNTNRKEESGRHYLVLWYIDMGEESQYFLLHRMGNKGSFDLCCSLEDTFSTPEDILKAYDLQ